MLAVCAATLAAQGTVADGAVRRGGREFLVNTYTYGYQSAGSLVGLTDGGYMVLFHSPTPQFKTNYALKARRYDSNDNPVADEFVVNPNYVGTNDGNMVGARVGRDGQFVAVWDEDGPGDTASVHASLFSPTGDQAGPILQVSESSPYIQDVPDVAGSADGFVVVWTDLGDPDVAESNVLARRYDVDGVPLGLPFSMPTGTAGWPTAARVSAATDGEFVVVWMELDIDGSYDGILARRYSAAGEPLNEPFVVNTRTVGPQQYPDVAFLTSGEFVVVWIGDDGDGPGIFGQRFSADGTPVGTEFPVNTSITGFQQFPHVEPDLEGGFFVNWVGGRVRRPGDGGDGSGAGVFGRHFNGIGEPDGDQFQVNIPVAGDQSAGGGAALFTAPDSFVISYCDLSERDGSGWATIAARFRLIPGTAPLCGDAGRRDLIVTSTDALASLRVSVGLGACELCVCDVDDSGTVTASDALSILRMAVGLPVNAECPTC